MTVRDFVACFTIAAFMCSCAGNGAPKPESPAPAKASARETPLSADPTEYYVLGEGDTIDLQVWRQENLKRSLKVDMQGNISVPLAGAIRVAGLTVKEATGEITMRLGKYYVDPQVDLFVSGSKSQSVNVFGEVSNPGTVAFDHKASAWEIIAKAAFTKNSNKSKVILIRNAVPNAEAANIKVYALNLDPGNIKPGDQPLDMMVQNGDILYVPTSKIYELDKLMSHISSILAPFMGVSTWVILWPQVLDVLRGTTAASSQGIIVGH